MIAHTMEQLKKDTIEKVKSKDPFCINLNEIGPTKILSYQSPIIFKQFPKYHAVLS
jgi:hypothetical protein